MGEFAGAVDGELTEGSEFVLPLDWTELDDVLMAETTFVDVDEGVLLVTKEVEGTTVKEVV